MKTTCTVNLQKETVAALEAVPVGCVNARSARMGLYEGEPLLVIADALLAYAKAYRGRYESGVANDAVFAGPMKQMLSGLHALLDGDGAVAMRRGITTDSKDNGSLCAIIEAACDAAGIDYQNL